MTLLRVQLLEDRIVFDGAVAHDVSAVIEPAHPAGPDPHALVIIADNINDSQGLKDNVSGKKADVLAYNYNGDTLDSLTRKINDTLAGKKVDSIAIVSDGAAGQFNLLSGLQINGTTLNNAAVQDFMHNLAGHLTPEGAINILGCNVAQDATGASFMSALANIVNSQGTKFVVNASTDPTGSSILGGDWLLEYSSQPNSSRVDASLLYFSDGSQDSWDHVLMPKVNITPTTGLVTTADGDTTFFTVSLNSQPTNDITVNFAISNSSQGTFIDSSGNNLGSHTSAIFTTSNWLTPQTVHIKGLNDGSFGPNGSYTITSTIAANNDPNYNPSMQIDPISVTYVSMDTNPYVQTRVWNDVNGNGFQDPGEPGVANVHVYLVNQDTSAIVGQQFTNSTGVTVFSNIAPGNYQLDWIIPQASISLSPYRIYGGLVSGFDSDALSLGTLQGQQAAVSNTFTVSPNTNVNHLDAGFILPLANLNTYVWQDSNANGLLDAGESKIPGVNVILHNTSTSNDYTSVTNSAGSASFSNILAGNYVLRWQLPAGVTYTLPGIGTNSNFNSQATSLMTIGSTNYAQGTSFNLTNGQTVNTINAGFIQAGATIVSTAWNDINANGVRDSNEPLNSNVSATLVDSQGATLATGTNVNGIITFNVANIPPGTTETARIVWTLPGGSTFTPKGVGGAPQFFSNASYVNGIIQSDPISLTNGKVINTANIGLVTTSLTTNVWDDANNNGIKDSGEVGISGLNVQLVPTTGSIPTVTLNDAGGGVYSVSGIALGQYQLKWAVPAGDMPTLLNQGLNGVINSNATLTGAPVGFAISSSTITIGANTSINNFNAGFVPTVVTPTTATVVSTAWIDTNGDGLFNNGEALNSSVTATLYDPNNNPISGTLSNGVTTFTITPISGSYHIVWTTLPTGFTITTANVGGSPLPNNSNAMISGSTIESSSFTMAAGQTTNNRNIGLIQPGSVTTFVWNDSNANGTLDAGEPGITGLTVQLVPNSGNSNPIVTLVANPNTPGQYTATSVAIGSYQLQWSIPSGKTITLIGQGNQFTTNSDAILTGAPSGFAVGNASINVTAGGAVTSIDAGFVPLGATIYSTSWNDTNGNGIYDSNETGNPNVVATLVDSQGTTVATGVNNNGLTTFNLTNLTPGVAQTYHIVWTLPAGTTFTLKDVGGSPQYSSDASLIGSAIQSDPFTVTNGLKNYQVPQPINQTTIDVLRAINTVNVGIVTSSLSTFVWNDLNSNGLQDPGEPGYSGLTVQLVPVPGNNNPTLTLTDNGSGTYTATGIGLGQYNLIWAVPAGSKPTLLGQGINAGINSDATLTGAPSGFAISNTTISVTGNSSITTFDAGFVPIVVTPTTATVISTAWNDANGNGLLDNGESLNNGVTATLYDPNNNPVTGTLVNGVTTFTVSTPISGNYTLVWTLPSGYSLTVKNVGGSPQTNNSDAAIVTNANPPPATLIQSSTFTLSAGLTVNTHNIGLLQTGTVNTLVWFDSNGNGVQDNNNPTTAREPGIPNAIVSLYSSLTGTQVGSSVTTNSSGIASFTNIAPGSYYLVWTNPNSGNYSVSPFNSQGGISKFANAGTSISGGTASQSANFTIGQNGNVTNFSAGFTPTSISTLVWNDYNGDGIRQSNEPGLTGLNVYAVLSTDPSNTPLPTASMGGGNYAVFGSTIPTTTAIPSTLLTAGGQYNFFWSIPANSVTTVPAFNAPIGTAGPATIQSLNPVQAIAGQRVNAQSLGIAGVSNLTTTVWYDANGNNIKDSGEPGIFPGSGTSTTGNNVLLYRFNTSGAPVLATSGSTQTNGTLTFQNLLPGTYFLEWRIPSTTSFSQVGGFTSITSPTGTTITPPDGSSYVISQPFSLNQQRFSGYNLAIVPTTISSTAWNDLNGNGVLNSGEPTMNGLTVTATRTSDSTQFSAVNIGNGIYRVFGTQNPYAAGAISMYDLVNNVSYYTLTPGNTFTFTWSIPSNFTTTIPGAANVAGQSQAPGYLFAQNIISTANFAGNPTGPWTATSTSTATVGVVGTNTGNVDVGFTAPASITIPLWFDSNGNGTYDSGTDPSLYDYLIQQGLNPAQIGVQLVANWIPNPPENNILEVLNGLYTTFNNIPVGSYYVIIEDGSSTLNALATVNPTIRLNPSNPLISATDSDFFNSTTSVNKLTDVFTMPPGAVTQIGGGFVEALTSPTIDTFVWLDDGSGIMNPNTGISGQQLILLYNTTGGGPTMNSLDTGYSVVPGYTFTDLHNGHYTFSNIPWNLVYSGATFQILYQIDTATPQGLIPTVYQAPSGSAGSWSDANPFGTLGTTNYISFNPAVNPPNVGTYFVSANNSTYGNTSASVGSTPFTLTASSQPTTFTDINAGFGQATYTVTYFLDVNQNGKLDTESAGQSSNVDASGYGTQTFNEPIITSTYATVGVPNQAAGIYGNTELLYQYLITQYPPVTQTQDGSGNFILVPSTQLSTADQINTMGIGKFSLNSTNPYYQISSVRTSAGVYMGSTLPDASVTSHYAGNFNVNIGVTYAPPSAATGNVVYATAWADTTTAPTPAPVGTSISFQTFNDNNQNYSVDYATTVNSNGYAYWSAIPYVTNPAPITNQNFDDFTVDNAWEIYYFTGNFKVFGGFIALPTSPSSNIFAVSNPVPTGLPTNAATGWTQV